MKRITKLGLAAILSASLPAWAVDYSVVGLGFEGMQVETNGVFGAAQVWEFYNGGFSRSQDGTTNLVLGPNDYNVSFTDAALAFRSINQGNGTGNFGPRYLGSDQPPELNDVGVSALSFTESVTPPVLNYASGFTVGFSFYYSSQSTVTVTLYAGLNAGGDPVGTGTFSGTSTCELDDNVFCTWELAAVATQGIARSVKLEGVGRQTLFDNLTFGSLTPIDGAIPVPEPGSYALMALGLAGVGWAVRRRRAHA
jgi:hypothetical protein